MVKPSDRLGFGPTRVVIEDGEGGYLLMVTPPAILGPKPTMTINLTADQYMRYLKWQTENILIQTALPEFTPTQREMIMTGLGDDDFFNATRSDDQ